MNPTTQKAFEIEEERNILAKRNQLEKLKKTYQKNIATIPNLNTGVMWDRLNRKRITKTNNPMAHDRITKIISYINGLNLKILDLGFGQGAVEERLNELGVCTELLGFDLSGESVARMSRRFKHWKFAKGNVLSAIIPLNRYDYVLALELLEHIQPYNVFEVLKKIIKSLKPKGNLIVSVPINEGLKALVSNGLNPNAHVRTYTPALITSELKIAGFEIVRTELLYAFSNLYKIKSIIARFSGIREPNNVIVLARKP
ncbi:MAG: Methyltransferase type 11 [Candidatus Amesbacteria bacterium GW2011_GWA2_47_11b]|uniref:Methyltransferase type 11 n=3 Tax=Candidatus Amesiibacteriota TaxID=1752730 RepID=A0A0G1VJB9_9BACT|nr:MAG: Methyltransferase type 11 [Candidatus Amesbacteria bacterium GW2011_GWA2_47_11b]KKU70135.1 MAG: Methyltransferase type 11 [Candidatus Amesbacteria bacterium GW2011_GWA1_47_20]KKU83067.1 MAG: Methyltransferase type 11 [Candidatus Amesbacteria bacterium GW2011_GWC2_47_8]